MNNNVFLDEDNMSTVVDKLNLYCNDENVSFDNLRANIISFNEQYKTNNSSSLDNKLMELNAKMKTISNIHSNNIFVLRRRIQQHIALRNLSAEILGPGHLESTETRVIK